MVEMLLYFKEDIYIHQSMNVWYLINHTNIPKNIISESLVIDPAESFCKPDESSTAVGV